jgi:F-type H+-transporting ATPase subunit epsilon
MNENNLSVTITTPQKKWILDDINSVTAPGVMGSFQVLSNHAPLMTQLEIGEVKLETMQGLQLYATTGGFLEVLENNVSLLLESCEKSDEIDLGRAESAAERARKRLKDRSQDIDLVRAEVALSRALNRIRIANKVV